MWNKAFTKVRGVGRETYRDSHEVKSSTWNKGSGIRAMDRMLHVKRCARKIARKPKPAKEEKGLLL